MFNSTVLETKESKTVIGGKKGPYGECVFIYGEWYRDDKDGVRKNGVGKRCNEK
ncbi:hypothetical protein SME41J_48480 (plasmid) [Serratia marcescens]|nr:hypothetical protein SME41J_48480 [Serratia marcescens]